MGRLDDKVVLVTGASGGQGAAAARLFAVEGAIVLIADVLVDLGQDLAEKMVAAGLRAEFVELDVASEHRWAEVVSYVDDTYGRLDVLVNNAGVSDRRGIMEQPSEAFDHVLAINLWGPVAGMQACAPLMGRTGGGSIVNISSVAGMTGYDAAGYASSKWGLRGVTRTAALELAPLGIRVNSVHPGTILTPMLSNVTRDVIDHYVRVNADPRPGVAEEIAHTVVHLAIDEVSSFTTGAEVVIDGGFIAAGAHRGQALRIAELQEESTGA